MYHNQEKQQIHLQLLIYVKNKVKTCSVVNAVESSIARSSDFVLPIHAGPEIGVASTKAFIGQMLVLYILAIKISDVRKEISKSDYEKKINDLKKLPDLIKKTLIIVKINIQIIAKDFLKSKRFNVFRQRLIFSNSFRRSFKT